MYESPIVKRVVIFQSGMSMVEILVAFTIFVLLFVSAIRNYTESNLPMQAMIRDYAIAMNLGEKLLRQTEDQIKSGEGPMLISSQKDITLDLLNNFDFQSYLEKFAGGISNTVNFNVIRTIENAPNTDLFHVTFAFIWRDKNSDKKTHRFSIQSSVAQDRIIGQYVGKAK